MQTATRFALRSALAALILLPLAPVRAQQLDPSFHVPVFVPAGTQAAPRVEKVDRQADGRYLVAGNFQSVDGHLTNGLARLLADGRVDTTFTFRVSGLTVSSWNWSALAVQADGRVLVARAYGSPQDYLLRLLPNGRVDAGFQPALVQRPSDQRVQQIVVQPDGKLLLSGTITDSLGRHGLTRLLSSGRLDGAFQPPTFAQWGQTAALLEPSGRIVFGQSTFSSMTLTLPTLVRLLPSGQLDASFNFVQNSPQGGHIS